MKKWLCLFFLFSVSSICLGQVEVITHNKVPLKVNYTQVLGSNALDGWELAIFPTALPYNGDVVNVAYPQYVKSFTLFVNGRVIPGRFAIKYDRFQNQDYLMFQIFLDWPGEDPSWFIAKAYGDNGIVNFYESDPISEVTLDPDVPISQGGPHVWRVAVQGFEPFVERFYDQFLEDLKGKTRQALLDALAGTL